MVLDGGGRKAGLQKGAQRAKIAGYCCCLIRKPEQSHGAAVHGLRFLKQQGFVQLKPNVQNVLLPLARHLKSQVIFKIMINMDNLYLENKMVTPKE